jgi:hypothetical protein
MVNSRLKWSLKPMATIPNRVRPHLIRWQKQDTDIDAGTRHVVRWHGNKVTSIKNSFKAAVKTVGLPKRVILHCLRHTPITWAMHSSADSM